MKIQNYGFLFNFNFRQTKNSFSNMINTISNSLSDYACVKSGGYGKLISAYYKKVNPDKRKEYSSYNSAGKLVKMYKEESTD